MKIIILPIPIKTVNAMRFVWKNIKYVTTVEYWLAWNFQPYDVKAATLGFLFYSFLGHF